VTGYRRPTWKILIRAAALYVVAVLFLMLPALGSPLADNPGLLFWLLPVVLLVALFQTSPSGSAGSGGWDGDGGGNGGGGKGNGGGDGNGGGNGSGGGGE
jgi:hypothetical protein